MGVSVTHLPCVDIFSFFKVHQTRYCSTVATRGLRKYNEDLVKTILVNTISSILHALIPVLAFDLLTHLATNFG